MIWLYFSFVLFVLAAVPYRPTEAVMQGYRYSLIAAGLACGVGYFLFGR